MRKTILAFMLIAALVFTNTIAFADGTKGSLPDNQKFTDVEKHWAKDAINKIADKGAFADKDGKFLPNKAITRSEFVMMLHKALDIRIAYFKAPDIKEYFSDVENEDAYASALYDLVTVNIIDVKGKFNPNGTLTREEMVHYIINAYKYKMGDSYKLIKIAPHPFADEKNINPLYSGDIARAEYMGITKRPASNNFYPKQNSTRAEAAMMIDRLLNQLEKEISQVQVISSAVLKDGTLTAKLTIVNHTDKKIVINHNSGQKFDFQLLDANKTLLYTWSADKMFIMALTETTIEPGKSVEYVVTFEKALLDNLKSKPAYVKTYIVGKSGNFSINSKGYEVEIK